jgi:multicomponent K+:H+ antiporter subunit F
MSLVLSGAIFFSLACYVLAMGIVLVRLLGGPSAQDRVLAIDYLYLNGLLIIVVLGVRHATPVYFEGALLIALLGFVSSAALAKFLLRGEVIE